MALTLLAIDSAGAACSAAVWSDGAVRAVEAVATERGHAVRLAPLAAAALSAAGIAAMRLDGVVATVGPGSFTGLRVGLALAHGIALAVGVPAWGMSSFLAHAAAVPVEERRGAKLVVALDSRRAERFFQILEGEEGAAAFAATLEDAVARLPEGPVLLAGDAADDLRGVLAAAARPVRVAAAGPADAACVARAAADMLGRGVALPPARPVYLRAPDVSIAAPR
ncbi:MAG: tRNA (adenosine(37)-N6)-threonylcarbamoyltransferase complex dimerization subunit type 1 TsaB [Alphaproteobacteria bacterium]|nr:tRNA (adenosine(37)-N6)-threonylcarbamoyltransferase complex dimerization subunit type 1 TsaB [Alphaproteobacteria bacterium]